MAGSRINWSDFLATPHGKTVAAWEAAACAKIGMRCGGDAALQLGTPELNNLTRCAISLQILANPDYVALSGRDVRLLIGANSTALPLASESIDFAVWPHGIESENAAATLSELYRVLSGEGILLVTLFNAAGTWSVKRFFGKAPELPAPLITNTAAQTLIKNAGFSLEGGRFGVYGVTPGADPENPDLKDTVWDQAGDRWLPTLGNVILLIAKKRTSNIKLVGKAAFGAAKNGRTALAR